MPAAPIASPPWVAGSWTDTAWELGTWGPRIPIVISLDPPFELVGLDGSLGSLDAYGLTHSFRAAGRSGDSRASGTAAGLTTASAQTPSAAVRGHSGDASVHGQAPSLGVRGTH